MTFLHTELLFLIWAVPLLALIFWYGHRKRRSLLAKFSGKLGSGLLWPAETPARRVVQAVLVLGALVFIILAIAGPQYGFQWQKIEREGVDIVIALDCSRSMLSPDIQPTRLDRAKREIIDLLGMLDGDRVALTAFSGTAFLQCPLTLDYQAFDLFLNVLTPDYLPVGGSDLAAAVRTAVSAFDPQSKADKAVILITDGENTGPDDPVEAAREAEKAAVKLFCIGVGADQGVPVPATDGGFKKDRKGQIVLSRLDETTLSRMALATGGAYVRSVAGDMDLDAIYRDHIRKDLKTATVESGRKQIWADRYQWPLALGVVALIIGLWLPLTRKPVLMLLLVGSLLLPVPESWAGPLQEGYKAYEDGDYEQALKSFVQGQLQKPDDPKVLYNLGNAYYQNKEYAAAREHYLEALKHLQEKDGDKEKINNMAADLHYNMGNAAFRQGEMETAVKDYEDALELRSDDAQAKENLAFVKQQLQQQKQQQQQQGDQQKDSKDQQPGQQSDQQAGQQSGQQQDQQQGQQDKSDQNQQQDGSENQADGQSGHQDQEQPKDEDEPSSSRRYADQMDNQDRNAGQSESEREQDQNQEQAQSAAAGNQEEPPAGEQQGRAQADQMLNRLKDEPGRAMMPNYQKRQVEKDW